MKEVKALSRGLADESLRLFRRIRNPESRNEDIHRFSTDFNILSRELFNNAFESPMGNKGEWWFVAQTALMTAVAVGTVPLLGVVMKLFGGMSVVSGLYYLGYGMLNMCESLSPFIFPASKNILKTYGAYSIVRHPIYSGLILLSFGLSIFTNSLPRFLLSTALAVLLDIKAAKEEVLLDALYPMVTTVRTTLYT
jgi:protein-S-isoprenylcysteine O-methyltransferase Ste14